MTFPQSTTLLRDGGKSCGDGQSNGTGTAEDSCLIPTGTVFDCVQYCRRLRQHWHWTVFLFAVFLLSWCAS
eukprot:scaffold4037_cov145-Skeletonema_marinoi.AAC.10